MTASLKTIRDIALLLEKFIPAEKMMEFVKELETIPGNSSFRETVSLLVNALERD